MNVAMIKPEQTGVKLVMTRDFGKAVPGWSDGQNAKMGI